MVNNKKEAKAQRKKKESQQQQQEQEEDQGLDEQQRKAAPTTDNDDDHLLDEALSKNLSPQQQQQQQQQHHKSTSKTLAHSSSIPPPPSSSAAESSHTRTYTAAERRVQEIIHQHVGALDVALKEASSSASSTPPDPIEHYRSKLLSSSSSSSSSSIYRQTPQALTLAVAHKTGQLAEVLQWKGELQPSSITEDPTLSKEIQTAAAGVAASVMALSQHFGIDLGIAMLAKIELNAMKYPAALVKGKAHKYQHYTEQTGIAKEGQTLGPDASSFRRPPWTESVTLSGVRQRLRLFAEERDWAKYHAPRNLLLAMIGEVGELCEILLELPQTQTLAWRWLVPDGGLKKKDKDSLAQELADVFIYVCRFCDVCGVDLGKGLNDLAAARAKEATDAVGGDQQQTKKEVTSSSLMLGGASIAAAVAVGAASVFAFKKH